MVEKDRPLIRFHYQTKPFFFPNRSNLKDFILKLFKTEGFEVGAINFIFCLDDYLLEINKAYLNHDTYTDIITFQYSSTGEPILSDIYISIDRVQENARVFNVPFLHELNRVIIHGALHLCGYKDKSKTDIKRMRHKEDLYLSKYVSRENGG